MYIPSSYPARLGATDPRRVLRVPVIYMRRRGMGDSDGPSSAQIVGGFATGATVGASTAISTGSNVAGAVAGGFEAAAPFFGPAAPIIAAIGLLVAPIAKMFQGCGQTCVQATQYANQADAAAQQIHDLYFAQPVRTVAMQQAALNGILQMADWLRQACSNPALGAAGQRCISERIVPGGTAPWCPNPGNLGCDWYSTLIYPIQNDTGVVPDPSPVSAGSADLLSSVGVDPSTTVAGVPIKNLLLPAALLGGFALMMASSK
jgi:hypothetical protein